MCGETCQTNKKLFTHEETCFVCVNKKKKKDKKKKYNCATPAKEGNN